MIRFLWMATLIATFSSVAVGKDIAYCGASEGYAFFPKAGLGVGNPDIGKWHKDPITEGKITLTEVSENEFDVLISDASGKVFSSKNAGGNVFLVGLSENFISVIIVYPELGESYTFMRNADGDAEVLWTSNK